MPCEARHPEGGMVDETALRLFSRVSGWTGRAAAMRVRNILADKLRPGMKVLDIGTGPGIIPLHLQRNCPGASFTGLDISVSMLEMASSNSERMGVPVALLAGDGEVLPIRAETFDMITSFFALHHMDQPGRFLLEADRALKPDGEILIIDFRRDMSRGLFRILDALWQLAFFATAGRFGFRDSVCSAWRPEEIEDILGRKNLNRFKVHRNRMELWIIKNERLKYYKTGN